MAVRPYAEPQIRRSRDKTAQRTPRTRVMAGGIAEANPAHTEMMEGAKGSTSPRAK